MARIWVALMIIPLSILFLPSRFQATSIDKDNFADYDFSGVPPDNTGKDFFATAERTSSAPQNLSFDQDFLRGEMINSGNHQDASRWSSYIPMDYLGSINKTASIWILVSGLLGFLGIHQSRSRNGL
ncbi:MAG TPA: hypothetical protein PLA83_01425 [Deltaproteobacteria bacterium]|jgi:hypothetical protein|nr:hypothetical protein [Deltaproteobacteria bacterium]HQI00585.1 hypothetical protein [Deltaproteobacteria bacterium]